MGSPSSCYFWFIVLNPSYLTSNKYYWIIILGIDTIWTIFTFITWTINSVGVEQFGFVIIVTIMQVYVIVRFRNYVKNSQYKDEELNPEETLLVFTRPKKLTEDEVSDAKEKKICLVCKNGLQKQIYLCNRCGSLYCIKCSDTLTTLENACWACNAPFDDTKPIKTQKEDLDASIEEPVLHKNLKNEKK